MENVHKPDTPIPKKRHISEITSDWRSYWEPLFDKVGLVNPIFGAKLGYNGKEFGEPKQLCVRFFPNEMSNGHDYYLELFNWDHTFYHANDRVLYRLKYDAQWESNPKIAKVIGNLATPTYAIRVSDLEVVNVSSRVTARPEIPLSHPETTSASTAFAEDDILSESSFEESYSESADDHYSKMTIRDHYCMKENLPFTNKPWLNELIKKRNSLNLNK